VANAPAKFTQAAVSRAIRANIATGSKHVIEIARDGTIRLLPAAIPPAAMNDDRKPPVTADEDPRLQSWD
jgi:hypothetical protein